ncbi:MAG: DUF1343 domain-containing protein [Proteobacteria bacterium]|nr:DUF1343 domain-containing protein [Pseudomonadota bacterium]
MIRCLLCCLLLVHTSLAIAQPRAHAVLTGIDVLAEDDYRLLSTGRVGLITNHTGVDRLGNSDIRLLHDAANVDLVRVFSPEHGISGTLDIPVIRDGVEVRSGIPIVSLYGEVRRPTPVMLADIDILVFDIQDIGTRFYTYISTMGYAMQAAAENGIRFVVLDRPNPINGHDVAGPVLDDGKQSFVGFHRLPVRHGMTIGELARMFNTELQLDLDLHVVRMRGWHRAEYFDATGLTWINPSPNIRNLTAAILYPGIGLLETTNLSVGRGTATPFELFGAPWLNAELLAAQLTELAIPGVRFDAIEFTPAASKFENIRCNGLRIVITDRDRFDPLRLGFEIVVQLILLHGNIWEVNSYLRLLGSAATLKAIREGGSLDDIEAVFAADLADFRARREKFLLYD